MKTVGGLGHGDLAPELPCFGFRSKMEDLMTASHESSKSSAGWTVVRPGVWSDSTKTSEASATELMAKRLERSGSRAAAARLRGSSKKAR